MTISSYMIVYNIACCDHNICIYISTLPLKPNPKQSVPARERSVLRSASLHVDSWAFGASLLIVWDIITDLEKLSSKFGAWILNYIP